jgi:hypothetical protein
LLAGALKLTVACALPATAPMPVGAPGAVTLRAKFAVTFCAAVMLTVQVPLVLLQAPLQPAKLLPAAAAALRITLAPLLKLALHVVPQSMPAGLLLTVPEPVLDTERTKESKDCPPRTSRTATLLPR